MWCQRRQCFYRWPLFLEDTIWHRSEQRLDDLPCDFDKTFKECGGIVAQLEWGRKWGSEEVETADTDTSKSYTEQSSEEVYNVGA